MLEQGDKMITINKNIQSEMIISTMEEMVPKESLFRKIDRYVDFTFIYEEVKDLYCSDNGRPSIDPVVLFKIVFIQALDGIKSMRKTCEKIKVDAEYRWFLKIPFGTQTPHFSTFSKNYERRFKNNNIFETIFINIVKQAEKYKLVNGEDLYTDSTHKKANANKNKYNDVLEVVAKKRKYDLESEINEERNKNGEKEFVYKEETEKKRIKVSKTDPEAGYYHRNNKEKGFMYLDHRTVCGKSNIIVDAYITKGNVHDSVPYIDRMNYIKETFGFEIKRAAVDSGYDSVEIKEYYEENEIFGVVGYRSYGTSKSEIKKKSFKYEKDLDCYICPETGVIMEYANHINKQGYKKYCNKKACINCPLKKECCGKSEYRIILRHIKAEVNERAKGLRLSNEGKALYSLRKEKVERSFADSKQNHGYRYAMYRGLNKNQNYSWLICSAQNMKNIALKVSKQKRNGKDIPLDTLTISKIFKNITKIISRLTQKKTSIIFNRGLSTI